MTSFLRSFLLVLFVAACTAQAQDLTDPAGWFAANARWQRAEDVSLTDDFGDLAVRGDGKGSLLYVKGAAQGTPLQTHAYIGDCVIYLEYQATKDAKAGLYLQGRYRFELGGAEVGQYQPPETRAAEGVDETFKPFNATGVELGRWQTAQIRFRAARFDDARNMVEKPLVLLVQINGKIVYRNLVPPGRSPGAALNWDDAAGPAILTVERGGLVMREFSIQRADFEAVKVPAVSGQATNMGGLVNFVKQGEELFRGLGCAECHAVKKDDASAKTGPNLFGLFMIEPRDRAIASGGEGHRFTIKADREYLHRSVRTPHDELAISEHGDNQGQPYPIIMPPYVESVLSDLQVDAIGSYLATLNEPSNQGPVMRFVPSTGPTNYDPLKDRSQLLVDRTLRIQRGPMEGVSGRGIHVGQPDGFNYSFDPRVLAIVKMWQGGFLDLAGEFLNRGGNGLKPGYQSREIELGATGTLLAPLNAAGERVDFSFKDPKFRDDEAVRASLNDPRDLLARIAEVDAQFLGYELDSTDAARAPAFNYRVGQNRVSVSAAFAADGEVTLTLTGDLGTAQSFAVNETTLAAPRVSAGELAGGRWTLPAGRHAGVTLRAKINLTPNPWRPTPSAIAYQEQSLATEPSKSMLPEGYQAEVYLPPIDNYGRDTLFEPLGMACAPDGTVVVATRLAGIWRLRDGKWHLFAEGIFDSLGVQVEDEHGLRVVVGQKAEVTRISDTNGDGRADRFETLADQFTFSGNYHAYMHGPVRDAQGDYFVTLNLNDSGQSEIEYRANGNFMGTSGGFRGWAIRVPATGGFEPWADGLRSPAGLGVAPDGRLWYADNQGEYMGTSKLFVLEKGRFYGHPAGLVDRPGMSPLSPEIAWDNVKKTRIQPVLLFPQSRLANSPGNPAWDTTGGKFGPYAGQMFIGDQTQSLLMRVTTEKVGAHEQGGAVTFAMDLRSGVMRPLFLPDGSLLLGQTGRGWQARGGRVASLQRLIWDGKTVSPGIHHVSAAPGGFDIHFTVAVPEKVTDAEVADLVMVRSWVYRDAADYGSPELDEHDEPVSKVSISADRRSIRVKLARTTQAAVHPEQTARVYRLTVKGRSMWWVSRPGFEAFYTLYEFPSAEP